MEDGPRKSAIDPAAESLFAGPGKIRARCRALDWAATPLGPVGTWPAALRAAARLCLDCARPMCVFGGPALVHVYNDAYAAAVASSRHPHALGRPAREVWADIWDQIGPEYAQVMAGGPAVEREQDGRFVVDRGRGPEETYWTYATSPIRDDDGRVVGCHTLITETSARVRAEAALRESVNANQRFTRLFQASPAPFLVLAPDVPRFTIVEVNDAYLAATMRRRDDLVGRGVFEAFPDNPADATIAGVSTLRASLARVLATRQSDMLPSLKYDIARPDGTFEERWWSPVNSAVLDENGEVEAIIHNANDVTEQHRAEAARRESEERLRRVLDGMREGFGLLAPDFTVLEHNREALWMDGRAREEIVGRSHWDAFPGTETSELGRLLKKAMAERAPVSLEHQYAWEEGRALWLEMRAYPTADGSLAVFWRDVTARVNAAEKNESLTARCQRGPPAAPGGRSCRAGGRPACRRAALASYPRRGSRPPRSGPRSACRRRP